MSNVKIIRQGWNIGNARSTLADPLVFVNFLDEIAMMIDLYYGIENASGNVQQDDQCSGQWITREMTSASWQKPAQERRSGSPRKPIDGMGFAVGVVRDDWSSIRGCCTINHLHPSFGSGALPNVRRWSTPWKHRERIQGELTPGSVSSSGMTKVSLDTWLAAATGQSQRQDWITDMTWLDRQPPDPLPSIVHIIWLRP